MSTFENSPINIDLDEEAEFLAEKVGCTLEEANLFIDTQMCYFEKIGVAHRSGEENEAQPETQKDEAAPPVVEWEECLAFIREKSGLPAERIEKLDEAQHEYEKSLGLIID